MGIPCGITLIVGGGFHGKSTLLQALEVGVYSHIPGDGRVFVVTDPSAMKVRRGWHCLCMRGVGATDVDQHKPRKRLLPICLHRSGRKTAGALSRQTSPTSSTTSPTESPRTPSPRPTLLARLLRLIQLRSFTSIKPYSSCICPSYSTLYPPLRVPAASRQNFIIGSRALFSHGNFGGAYRLNPPVWSYLCCAGS